MNRSRRLPPVLGLLLVLAAPAVGLAEDGTPWAAFEERSFEGNTVYRELADGRLAARSEAAASCRFRERPVDLVATPWLCWSWRVETFPDVEDETTREGDDFAARVYVVDERGPMGLATIAINYVWTRHPPSADFWWNPYARRVAMVPVRTGPGGWRHEIRNVAEDFARIHGEAIARIDGVAVMTDSDDSGSVAAARYGELRFAATPAECASR